jgi:hypothetical protein
MPRHTDHMTTGTFKSGISQSRAIIRSTAHTEIKFRGPDNVVFDLSPSPWPGAAPVAPDTMKQPLEEAVV